VSIRITSVTPDSLADLLGWQAGDEIVSIDGHRIGDEIDFRFYSADAEIEVRLRRNGMLREERVERPENEPFGVSVEEFVIRPCADDCVFCFVDQNPAGLREALYFRDSDPRMSFLYGNYITTTNLRQSDLDRIVEQRLSPMYISVHCTDDAIRRKMMGHRKQSDRLMEKMQFFRENDIEMHTQIVLVPGYNDGKALIRTIEDLWDMRDAVKSVSVVPVGLTSHRQGLEDLRHLSPDEARGVIGQIQSWQTRFRKESDTGFVYASDEMYILAGIEFPEEVEYDGFPLMENGVGMCRDFLDEFEFQVADLPASIPDGLRVTLVTGTLAAPILEQRIVPRLNRIGGLEVSVRKAENRIFGPAVTVSGLLGYRCIRAALGDDDPGDLVLLPPDCINFEGDFLDNVPGRNRPEDLATAIGRPVRVFAGDWQEALSLERVPS
jgi:putative radical SAM enzyme (TIGR03279 family)